jgi:hypothetical protein
MNLFKIVIAVALSQALSSCGNATSDPLTDLGPTGNKRAATRYTRYTSARSHSLSGCDRSGAGPRILLSGFGPYLGVRDNVSGLVAESLTTRNPSGNAGQYGIKASQKQFFFNGKNITVCSVVLEVQWDLAAAGVLFEVEKFKPDVILMTGLGSKDIRLEAGALNDATQLSGYEQNGSQSGSNNLPKSPWVLPPGPGVEDAIPFAWNTRKIATENRRYLRDLNDALGKNEETEFMILPQTEPNPKNNYICNNTAFVVQHGVQGVALSLAGNEISLRPHVQPIRALGFLHYPKEAETDPMAIRAWGNLILNIALSSGNF